MAKGSKLEDFINSNSLDVMSVVTADMNGIARGKKVPARKLLGSANAPVRISNIMAMLDCGGMPFPPPEGDGRWWPSWAEGYTDTRGVVDPDTLRLVPWQQSTGLAICDFERVDGGGQLHYMPRPTLRRLVNKLADLGFETKAANELEFMLFNETAETAAQKHFKNLEPLWSMPQAYCLTTMGRHEDVVRQFRENLEGFGISIETWNAEAGTGQLEMNFPPSNAMAAADEAFLFKHAVREIAAMLGLYASFVPKLALLGFGNGNHLNFSLWKDGKNAFHSGDANRPMSNVLERFLAGITTTLREFTLMYAPTVMSYRRFVPYFSTGMMVSWGLDNKSVATRTVVESPDLTRIEQRTAGADVNPYCLMAACIAAGLHGVENDIALPECTTGDAYADASLKTVPMSMEEAIGLFEQSEVANRYLGEDFVRFYAHGRRAELNAFKLGTEGQNLEEEITDWEFARYFDLP